jgi:bifunctional UDP-N-acetylglucosamine pyrophosphorylase/glucosamine-1-phosphate N-acetyltransferase
MATPIDVVIMAAGKGTRMKSSLPKVLHRLGGKALLAHVIECAASVSARKAVVITGHGAEQVEAACARFTQAGSGLGLEFARQEPQLGTGHAVQQALPLLADDGVTLVLSGDVPLTQAATLQALIAQCDGQRLALLTLTMADPTGYGRIVRAGEASQVRAIVEHKDASAAQREIREVYSGIMAVPTRLLSAWLARLDNNNAQGEYYLTDIVKFAVEDGRPWWPTRSPMPVQVAGVNSPVQLAELERVHQSRGRRLMEQGVRLADPARLDVRGTLTAARMSRST